MIDPVLFWPQRSSPREPAAHDFPCDQKSRGRNHTCQSIPVTSGKLWEVGHLSHNVVPTLSHLLGHELDDPVLLSVTPYLLQEGGPWSDKYTVRGQRLFILQLYNTTTGAPKTSNMAPSLLSTAAGVLLLFSLSSAVSVTFQWTCFKRRCVLS